METLDKISRIVKSQLPDFYQEEAPNLVAFMEAYYEYMEQSGKLTNILRNLKNYRDIATTTEEYLEYFINDFIPGLPQDVLADKKLLIKYISQENRSRGTLSSYKLLFRVLYNEDIEVNYPADQILKVSDGDWRLDRYLVSPYDSKTYQFIGRTIVGVESGAEALVEDVVRRMIRGRDLNQIILSNIKGTFTHLEPIRLKSDINAVGWTPIVEAGISNIQVVSPGAEYRPGDIVDILSDIKGKFGKVVVTEIQNLGGVITFNLSNGGSGYTASDNNGTTDIIISGGDGDQPASFAIDQTDIVDLFSLSVNINLLNSNNVFGSLGPTVGGTQLSTFKDNLISMCDYGFQESGETVGNRDYRDHANAVLIIANTSDPSISVGASLYGVTSGANATVDSIGRAYDSTDVVLRVNGYKKFTSSEKVNISTASGTTVGTVSSFYANTIGYHVAEIGWIANTDVSPLLEGDELVGRTSGAYGVVKKIVDLTSNGYSRSTGGSDDRDLYTVQLTSNTSANLTSQFDTGPMAAFIENEGLRLVGANTTVGNVVFTTSNAQIENVYTKLSDSFLFAATSFGTISKLSRIVTGENYTIPPKVTVQDNAIGSLGIGEQYITLQSDDVNWNTGNSQITNIDSTDRVLQGSTGASGDVKGGDGVSQPQVIQWANGTYEMVARVWQDFLQRDPGNIRYANNATVTLEIFDTSYVPGEPDTRTKVATGSAKIVNIRDRGVLGKNAVVDASVGANGVAIAVRAIDSGFSHIQNERVRIAPTNRTNAASAEGIITLSGVANSEGYYATTRSHLDTLRGFIQDSYYYQEYSYQIASPVSFNRYREYALGLVHPAGQILFGKYKTQSSVDLPVTASANNTTRLVSNGTVSLTEGSFDISGTSTSFLAEFANNGTIYIEHLPKQYYAVPLNIVSDNTTANLAIAWANSSISSANAYYYNSGI
jgi:hypothetical protein